MNRIIKYLKSDPAVRAQQWKRFKVLMRRLARAFMEGQTANHYSDFYLEKVREQEKTKAEPFIRRI